MITYNCNGLVFGNYWGGGQGAYQSKKLEGFKTKKELLKEAKKMLKDGSLDGGMGYESLIGALLNVEMVDKRIIEGKEFINKELEFKFIGNINEEQENFLIDCFLDS